MLIKVILIVSILLIAAVVFRTSSSDSNLALRRLAMTGFTILAVISVIWPDLTSMTAKFLGVNRGTDLVLYLFILAFLLSVMNGLQRNTTYERRFTGLARNIALHNVTYPDSSQNNPSQIQ